MTTVQPSIDFIVRANLLLEAASAGHFFEKNKAKLVPSFHRGEGDDANNEEFTLGAVLGKGAYCYVSEITAISARRAQDDDDDHDDDDHAGGRINHSSSHESQQFDETDFPMDGMFRNTHQMRKYMSENYLREDTEGKHARYALKQLKPTDDRNKLEQGLIDIAIEAKFLSYINHPNIIKLRGVAGTTFSPNFSLVLDRLDMTLQDKIEQWATERRVASSSRRRLCGCYCGDIDANTLSRLVFSAITVAYDLSCALRHIHSFNLVYRDLKPENAGFDVRGTIKLFDFGFCKELRKDLYDESSGFYNLTKMTGSTPYMAPENLLGKPYGKPADVFSFGVLIWEMLHCTFAFRHFNPWAYKEVVAEKNCRPRIDKSLPPSVKELIKDSWDHDPKKRPSFERLSLLLKNEYQDIINVTDPGAVSRSQHLLDSSRRSFQGMLLSALFDSQHSLKGGKEKSSNNTDC